LTTTSNAPGVSIADLHRIRHALEVILRPEDAEDTDDYRRRVLGVIKDLTGADRGASLVYVESKPSWVTDYPLAPLANYEVRFESVAPGVEMLERQVTLGVHQRDDLWLPVCATFYETAYFCDYLTKLRAFDGMGVTWRKGGGHSKKNVAQLMVHHASTTGRRFESRERAILQLLSPALESGLANALHGAGGIVGIVESLEVAALLIDPKGRILHSSPAARTLFSSTPGVEADVSQALMAALTGWSSSGLEDATPAGPAIVSVPIGGRRAGLRLTRTSLGGDRGTGYLVTMPTPGDDTDLERLASAKGLTPRQVEIAVLLSRRRRSREIAAHLGISVSTVRRHEEQVFARLDVRKRTDVERALRATSNGDAAASNGA